MGIKINFNPQKFQRDMEKQIVDLVKRKIPELISTTFRDAETGEQPKVTFQKTPRSLTDLRNMPVKLEGSSALLDGVRRKVEDRD